jgi:tRNA(fMet)-specific endonuclease VapC
MGLVYLADTNVVSEMMRPQPNETAVAQWREKSRQIAIAAITWHELLAGVYRLPQSKRRAAFDSFLQEQLRATTPILAYDHAAAEWHAAERTRLSQLGRTPSFADGQIAAIAAVNNLTLVTGNTADFAHFTGLRLENWLEM